MSGGKASRRKGLSGEREFCKLYGGERVPLSGAAGGSFKGDMVDVPYLGRGEIKRRARGFQSLYNWLADNDFLAVRADRKDWLVIMRADRLKQILGGMNDD